MDYVPWHQQKQHEQSKWDLVNFCDGVAGSGDKKEG